MEEKTWRKLASAYANIKIGKMTRSFNSLSEEDKKTFLEKIK